MRLPLTLLTVLLLAPLAALHAADIALVIDGKPRAVVVVGKSSSAKASAQSLIAHVERVSTAKLKLASDVPTDAAAIFVGESETTRKLGIETSGLKAGGFIMRTVGNQLVLAGNDANPVDPNGMAHAVLTFAERVLGVRYLWPGELGLMAPDSKTIRVGTLDVRVEPMIAQRKMRAYFHNSRIQTGLDYLGLKSEELAKGYAAANRSKGNNGGTSDWFAFHKLGGDAGIEAGHSFGYVWEKYHAEHPEWFALQPNGSRDLTKLGPERARLCKSNPALIAALAADKIAKLKKSGERAISLALNDGASATFCQCEKCKALDAPDGRAITLWDRSVSPEREFPHVSLTDRHVWFWNQLAGRITREVPDVSLGVYAYSVYKAPPLRERLHPSLTVGFVGISYKSDAEREDARKDWITWSQMAPRLFWRPNLLLMAYREGVPINFAHKMGEDVRLFAERGLVATDIASCTHSWATEGLNYYVLAKLLWDPRADVDAIIDDYCSAGFGAAAAPVKEYFTRIEAMTTEVARHTPATAQTKDLHLASRRYTPAFTAELAALLDQASAAGNDTLIQRRIAFLRIGLDFARLQHQTHLFAENHDPKTITAAARDELLAFQQRKWLTMRRIAREQPLAINVGCVAWGSENAFDAFGFKGAASVSKQIIEADEDGRPIGNERPTPKKETK